VKGWFNSNIWTYPDWAFIAFPFIVTIPLVLSAAIVGEDPALFTRPSVVALLVFALVISIALYLLFRQSLHDKRGTFMRVDILPFQEVLAGVKALMDRRGLEVETRVLVDWALPRAGKVALEFPFQGTDASVLAWGDVDETWLAVRPRPGRVPEMEGLLEDIGDVLADLYRERTKEL